VATARQTEAAETYRRAAHQVELGMGQIADGTAGTDALAAVIAEQRRATDELLEAYLQ
jgi:hypothetical protein